MAICVVGGTGAIGSLVIERLAQSDAEIRALARAPERAAFPDPVKAVKGDLNDPASIRGALEGVTTLFLLNAVTSDELVQAITTLNLADDAGVRGIVYFSAIDSDRYGDVPHMTAKYTVERMIAQLDLPATILRPSYFMQNDLTVADVIRGADAYPMPIGTIGVAMVDTRDIADAVTAVLLERERAPARLPRETIDLINAEMLTGPDVAKIWSDVLGRDIAYEASPALLEQRLQAFLPVWMAYDMRKMFERFAAQGVVPGKDAVGRFTQLLGRAPRSYRDFAVETARQWQQA